MKQISSVNVVMVRIILILICVVTMSITGLYVLYTYDNKYTAKAALTQDGSVVAPDGGVRFLVDGWQFYPDRLLTPSDFSNAASVPGGFHTSLGDYPSLAPFHKDQNPYGVSTYRIRLRGAGQYSLYLQEPLCAVTVYLGNTRLGGNGTVSSRQYEPLIRDAIYSFSIDGDTELTIQTANYSHYYGGLYYPPALGDTASISRMLASRMVFYGLLCFSSLALALFCTVLWIGQRGQRDKVTFYFGLLSLSFAGRVCYPFLRLAGVPLIRTLYAFEDAAALIGLYCVVRISLILFTSDSPNRMKTFVCAVSTGMCAASTVIPLTILPEFPAFTTWYGLLMSWYKVTAAVFLLGIALYGAVYRHPHAGCTLAGITVYGICLFFSIFSINQYEPIRTGWQDEYGSFLLVLVFASIMIQRSHLMATDNMRLTRHLQEEVDKKTQHLTLLLRERSQLMAELSHDMKTPVTSLSNMVQLMRLNNILLNTNTKEEMQRLEERCKDLADRIYSIQKFTSETESIPQMQEISLKQYLTSFHRDVQPVVEMSGPDFTCRLTPLPCTVLADKTQLQRVLENLVFNAMDFTPPEGHIQITLEQDGSFAYIGIADTGCGIQNKDISRVFDRFYTTRGDQGGQGLGLAIAKSIILEHHGNLTVQSTPGTGTVFTIQLPLLR